MEKIPRRGLSVQIHEGPYAGRTATIKQVDRKGTIVAKIGNKEVILEYRKYTVI